MEYDLTRKFREFIHRTTLYFPKCWKAQRKHFFEEKLIERYEQLLSSTNFQ